MPNDSSDKKPRRGPQKPLRSGTGRPFRPRPRDEAAPPRPARDSRPRGEKGARPASEGAPRERADSPRPVSNRPRGAGAPARREGGRPAFRDGGAPRRGSGPPRGERSGPPRDRAGQGDLPEPGEGDARFDRGSSGREGSRDRGFRGDSRRTRTFDSGRGAPKRYSKQKPRPKGPPRPEPTRHPERAAVLGGRRAPLEVVALPEAWLATRDDQGRFEASALLQHAEWAALVPSIERAGADVAAALPRLAEYIAAVIGWNRTVSNLISRSDESRLVSRHLAESLEPAGWLKEFKAKQWIDLGSGAGFPALPLAIVGVGKNWLLVESRRPKTLFLRRVTQDLRLTNVQVAHARLEDVLQNESEGDPSTEVIRVGGFPFDAFTSRATLTLPPTLEMAAASLKPGGHAFLWKGSGRTEEKAANPEWAEHWEEGRELELESGHIAICNFILRS